MTPTDDPTTEDWAATMHALAEGADIEPPEPEAPPVDWFRLTTAAGTMLDWCIVSAGDSRSGRRLLVVELDDDAEARVLDALEVLAGRQEPVSTDTSRSTSTA